MDKYEKQKKEYLEKKIEEALTILYNLEDKTEYKNNNISEAINLLQKEVGEAKHNNKYCPKYKDKVLPNEKGNCSLCNAELTEEK